MPGAPFLRGERLTLRPVESADHEYLARHWNEPTIRHATSQYYPLTESRIEAFLEREAEHTDAVHLLPCRDDTPVGFAWLFRVDDIHDRAELGYWIEPDERGQGYATEAARLCLRHAFDERNCRKVLARVFDYNDASMRVLEKLDFREEGRLRDHYYIDGQYVDTVLYGLLENEYRES